jgi:hypothetical protein
MLLRMSSVTFDTHEFVKRLRDAGLPEAQAEAVIRAVADAQGDIVTRQYLDSRLDKDLAPIRTDLAVLKWMVGIMLAGVASLVLKAYFSL